MNALNVRVAYYIKYRHISNLLEYVTRRRNSQLRIWAKHYISKLHHVDQSLKLRNAFSLIYINNLRILPKPA